MPDADSSVRHTTTPWDVDAVLDGRWVSLRPVRENDLTLLHRLAMSDQVVNRWRTNGMIADRHQFAEMMLGSAELNVVIEARADGRLLGLGQCYGTDLRQGHSYLAVMADPEWHRTPQLGEGLWLLIRHAFTTLPVHKLCAEIPEYNWAAMLRGDELAGFRREGTLRRHVYLAGRRWDVALFAMFRDDYEAGWAARAPNGQAP